MNPALKALRELRTPRLMGILNVTDDSFSDGGCFLTPDAALRQAELLLAQGAEILDIGGESTRPGSQGVSPEEELRRVLPVLERAREAFPAALISVDTRKAVVARHAIELGAAYINDISALRADPGLAGLVAAHPQVSVILMHMQGAPDTMQADPHYTDVLGEICSFFEERIEFSAREGISRDRLLLDPGIGFGKNLEHNLKILTNLDRFKQFGLPLVLGASRKRFIAHIEASLFPTATDLAGGCRSAADQSSPQAELRPAPATPGERLGGTLAAALLAALQEVDILRVHDVQAHRQFFAVLEHSART